MFFRRQKSGETPATFRTGAGIKLENVSVRGTTGQQDISILQNISCQLLASRTALLGLNGSGKSTFLKLLNGLVEPASGRVKVDDVEVESHLSQVRQRVGLLFSDPQTQLIMPTPLEDIELSLQRTITQSRERREKALALLAKQGLAHRARSSVYDISGGERQLTALTAVLAVEPKILLLDEPTTLLDLRNKLKLMHLLDTLPQQIIMSTHDLELAATCNEALVIHEGRLIKQGPAAQVISSYQQWCSGDFPA